jgi:hypothetical protein
MPHARNGAEARPQPTAWPTGRYPSMMCIVGEVGFALCGNGNAQALDQAGGERGVLGEGEV